MKRNRENIFSSWKVVVISLSLILSGSVFADAGNLSTKVSTLGTSPASCKQTVNYLDQLQVEILNKKFDECDDDSDKPCTLMDKMEEYDRLMAEYVILTNIRSLKNDISEQVSKVKGKRKDIFLRDYRDAKAKIDKALLLGDALNIPKTQDGTFKAHENFFYNLTTVDKLDPAQTSTEQIATALKKHCKSHLSTQLCKISNIYRTNKGAAADQIEMLTGLYQTYGKNSDPTSETYKDKLITDFSEYKKELQADLIQSFKDKLEVLTNDEDDWQESKLTAIKVDMAKYLRTSATLMADGKPSMEPNKEIKNELDEAMINLSKSQAVKLKDQIESFQSKTNSVISGRHGRYIAKLESKQSVIMKSLNLILKSYGLEEKCQTPQQCKELATKSTLSEEDKKDIGSFIAEKERYHQKLGKLLEENKDYQKNILKELKEGNILTQLKGSPHCKDLDLAKNLNDNLPAVQICLENLDDAPLSTKIDDLKLQLKTLNIEINKLSSGCKDQEMIKRFIISQVVKQDCKDYIRNQNDYSNCRKCDEEMFDSSVNMAATIGLENSSNDLVSFIYQNNNMSGSDLEATRAACRNMENCGSSSDSKSSCSSTGTDGKNCSGTECKHDRSNGGNKYGTHHQYLCAKIHNYDKKKIKNDGSQDGGNGKARVVTGQDGSITRYDEHGNVTYFDADGNLVDINGKKIKYDKDGNIVRYEGNSVVTYNENGAEISRFQVDSLSGNWDEQAYKKLNKYEEKAQRQHNRDEKNSERNDKQSKKSAVRSAKSKERSEDRHRYDYLKVTEYQDSIGYGAFSGLYAGVYAQGGAYATLSKPYSDFALEDYLANLDVSTSMYRRRAPVTAWPASATDYFTSEYNYTTYTGYGSYSPSYDNVTAYNNFGMNLPPNYYMSGHTFDNVTLGTITPAFYMQ